MRAGLLLRISDDREGEGLGVARQEKDCRDLATRKGHTIVDIFLENDTSAFKRSTTRLPDGSTALRVVRPEFRRALTALATGDIEVLIAYDLDRVARDPRDLEDLIDVIESTGRAAVSVTGSLDLSNDAGITMARVMVAVANKSSRDTARRIRRKNVELAEAGKVGNGGHRPFGYQRDRCTVEPDEARELRWAYQQVLAGRALRSICHDWTARGVTTTTGRPWTVQALRYNLLSGRNAGLREHRRQIVGPAVWPAIIDRGTWDTVHAVLMARSQPPGANARKYLLSGFLFCGRCGARLYPLRTSQTQRFGCKPTKDGGCGGILVRYEPAEEHVVELLLSKIEREVDLAPHLPHDRTAELLVEIGREEARLTALAEAFADDPDSNPLELRAAGAKIRRRIADLRGQVAREQATARMPLPVDVRTEWAGYDLMQRRELLGRVVERIVVHPAAVRGRSRFDPDRLDIRWA
jgi:DNA invertase Pin-like site-specific DNA recombinase